MNGLKPYNKKRILRIMQMKQLMLKKRVNRQERPHLGQVMTIHSNIRWCSDILQIKAWDGGKVYVIFSLDCHDREIMGFLAKSDAFTHRDVIALMDQTVVHRFGETIEKLPHEIQWLTDQGPQYIAHETREYARSWGMKPINTPAYSPESNGMAESFVKTFKRDYVYASELWTVDSIIRAIPEWIEDYNKNHPHSALQMRSPLEYREALSVNPEVSV